MSCSKHSMMLMILTVLCKLGHNTHKAAGDLKKLFNKNCLHGFGTTYNWSPNKL